MSYKTALEAAGAQVLAYEEFGCYQGSWWAKVVHEGQTGWVQGGFGSCTVCDPYQAAMDGLDYRWDNELGQYVDAPEEERAKALVEFGAGYLHNIQTPAEAKAWAERILAEEDSWEDSAEGARFIMENL